MSRARKPARSPSASRQSRRPPGRQWGEFVEQGHDQNRRNDHHDELESGQTNPRPKPPARAQPARQLQNHNQQRTAQRQAQQQTLRPVQPPKGGGGGIEAEPLLQLKLSVPFKRQIRGRQEHSHRQEKSRSGPYRGAGGLLKNAVKPREHAAEEGDGENQGAPSQIDHFEAALGQGISDRFGVSFGCDRVGESGRNRVGMGLNMLLVEPFERHLREPFGHDQNAADPDES